MLEHVIVDLTLARRHIDQDLVNIGLEDANVFFGQPDAIGLQQFDELLAAILAERGLVLQDAQLHHLLFPKRSAGLGFIHASRNWPFHKVLLEAIPVLAKYIGRKEPEDAEVVSLPNLLWGTGQHQLALNP